MKIRIVIILACILGNMLPAAESAGLLGGTASAVKAVLFPRQEALIAVKVDGTLLRHYYLVGQRFKAGDTITQIDDAHYRLLAARSEAQKLEAATLATIAADTFDAQRKLYEENMQSKVELDRRAAELATARSRKKITEAEYSEAILNLGYCRITAPFDGRVEEILIREHETVRNGQPVIRIIGDRELLAVVNLPVKYLAKVQGRLSFRFPEGPEGRKVSGRVFEISPRADHRSGTIEVKVLIDNASGLLTSGMTGVFLDGE
ncbi:MAG: efflux RND transporter periplasmic adaptor subunit [Lentisphaeria bacterium]|nr:efflux RND transporter periplasmic adaptor subunit [Lentisphaeria bacterium]